jgi:hypothetical protein
MVNVKKYILIFTLCLFVMITIIAINIKRNLDFSFEIDKYRVSGSNIILNIRLVLKNSSFFKINLRNTKIIIEYNGNSISEINSNEIESKAGYICSQDLVASVKIDKATGSVAGLFLSKKSIPLLVKIRVIVFYFIPVNFSFEYNYNDYSASAPSTVDSKIKGCVKIQ